MVVVHTFDPNVRRQRQVYFSEFETSLVYRVRSRIARTVIQRRETLSRKTKIWQTCVCVWSSTCMEATGQFMRVNSNSPPTLWVLEPGLCRLPT